jgi:hypothetical protein
MDFTFLIRSFVRRVYGPLERAEVSDSASDLRSGRSTIRRHHLIAIETVACRQPQDLV